MDSTLQKMTVHLRNTDSVCEEHRGCSEGGGNDCHRVPGEHRQSEFYRATVFSGSTQLSYQAGLTG